MCTQVLKGELNMSELQVRFTFDDILMEKNKIKKDSVYHTLKKHFEQSGLVCVSDNETLSFSGTEKDYGSIWMNLIALMKRNWFMNCTASCEFIENGKPENVLQQIPELRRLYKQIKHGIPKNRTRKNAKAVTQSDSTALRRQIYLRLSEQKLKKYYPRPKFTLNPKYYRKAWSDIEKIMTAQGFECKNHSLYISTEPVSNAKVNIIINAMGKALPWFPKCLTAIDVESVGQQRDLTGYFRKVVARQAAVGRINKTK